MQLSNSMETGLRPFGPKPDPETFPLRGSNSFSGSDRSQNLPTQKTIKTSPPRLSAGGRFDRSPLEDQIALPPRNATAPPVSRGIGGSRFTVKHFVEKNITIR